MRTGRPTNDKKDYVIQLRVNDRQKEYVKKMSIRNGVSESEFIRGLINKNLGRQI